MSFTLTSSINSINQYFCFLAAILSDLSFYFWRGVMQMNDDNLVLLKEKYIALIYFVFLCHTAMRLVCLALSFIGVNYIHHKLFKSNNAD